MKDFKLTLIIIYIIVANFAHADVVKYTDSKGYTFFVDSIDKIPNEYKDQVQKLENKHTVSRVKSDRKELYEKSSYPNSEAKTNTKLEIFVTDWCGYCRALEADLKKEGIPHQKYNIETSEVGRKIYTQLGGGGIPLIRINGKTVMRGYSSLTPIKEALKSN